MTIKENMRKGVLDMDMRFGEVNDCWKMNEEIPAMLRYLAYRTMNGTIEETNAYWMKQDEQMRNSENAKACGHDPRWLKLDTISIAPKGDGYSVSYYDPFWKVMQKVKASKFWGETLAQEIKNYDPNGRFEAYAYHRILGIIGFCCGAADVKPDLPEIDRTKASNTFKAVELMWKEMKPQLYPKWPQTVESMWPRVQHLPEAPNVEPEPILRARLKPESEPNWIIKYEPISSRPIFRAMSKPATDENWIVEEFVVHKDGTEEIRRNYRIENKLVKDWMQGFQRRRNNGTKRKKKQKDNPEWDWAKRIANAPPAKVVSLKGPSIGTRSVSKKEETIIEPGYNTEMIKTTYEYERYLRFDTEENLNKYVDGNNITLDQPQYHKYVQRKVLSCDVYSEKEHSFQHLMVPTQVTKYAPKVWKKTENNTLTYEHSIEIEYKNDQWETTLSDRQRVIELPPIDRKPVDISEEEEENEDVE